MFFEEDVNDQLQSEPRQKLTSLTIAAGLRAAANEMSWSGESPRLFGVFQLRGPVMALIRSIFASSRRDREGLLKLADALSSGETLDRAIENVPGLPEDLREIVSAGVQTGRLPRLLEEYLETNRQSRSLWRGFYLNLLYPVLILFLSFLVVAGFVLIVVPQFKEIFEGFGVELPVSTIVLITLSDSMQVIWVPALIVFFGLLLFFIFNNFLPFAHFRAKLFHMLPWVGTAQKMAASSEFCSRLAVLVECRVPLEESLRIVSKTMHDPYFSHIALKISDRVESGAAPEDLVSRNAAVPSPLANSFRWAHNPETFAEGLRSLSIVFASQARLSTGHLIVITEPIAIIGVGLLSGFVVIAMFAPLIKLLNDLS